MPAAFLIQAFVMDGGIVSDLQRRKLEPPGLLDLLKVTEEKMVEPAFGHFRPAPGNWLVTSALPDSKLGLKCSV